MYSWRGTSGCGGCGLECSTLIERRLANSLSSKVSFRRLSPERGTSAGGATLPLVGDRACLEFSVERDLMLHRSGQTPHALVQAEAFWPSYRAASKAGPSPLRQLLMPYTLPTSGSLFVSILGQYPVLSDTLVPFRLQERPQRGLLCFAAHERGALSRRSKSKVFLTLATSASAGAGRIAQGLRLPFPGRA